MRRATGFGVRKRATAQPRKMRASTLPATMVTRRRLSAGLGGSARVSRTVQSSGRPEPDFRAGGGVPAISVPPGPPNPLDATRPESVPGPIMAVMSFASDRASG